MRVMKWLDGMGWDGMRYENLLAGPWKLAVGDETRRMQSIKSYERASIYYETR